MGSKSNYLENIMLDGVLGGPDYTRPATVYIALYTATPSDTGGGTECTGGSYARASVTNNATNWPAAASGAKANGTEIIFTTATGNWGTVVAFSIMDDPTAGNFLYWGDVTPNKAINTGDTAKFAVGDIDITED
jgi:hypothetical protein